DLHIAYRHNTGQDLYHATVQGHNTDSSTRSALLGATCTFSPPLPTGLNIESGTCTISGVPTIPQVNTTHTITATSSTGLSYTGEFYLNVMDQTPVISYSDSPFSLTKDLAISTITPTNTGGSATSWSISPAEPAGLTFDPSTGEITGTPTVLSPSATYTVTATNTGGTDSTTISLSILDSVPIISYATTTFDLIVGEAMTSIFPSNSGGAATSWSISPAEPAGLNFYTSTGELSGTPTAQSASQAYTVTATNSGGTDTATLTIEVQVFATLTSSVEGISDVPNSAITPITFTHTINGDTSSPPWTSGVSASSTQVIDGSFTHGNDIAQGPNGAMAIVGYEADSDDMKLAYYYDGSWTTSVIQNSATPLEYPSVGIDSNGVLHIVYLDMTNDVLRYATNLTGTWQVSDIDTTTTSVLNLASGRIPGTDLAIDSTDNLHIVFSTKDSSGVYHSINYTTNQGGTWTSVAISHPTRGALDPAIALDSNDKVHVSYYRDTGSDLIYATNEGGTWTRELVESTNNVGKYSSIAVDYNDVVHISYVKADTNNDLKLASGNTGSFSISTVQDNQEVEYTSIAADSNGDLHIVYGKASFASNYILEYITNHSGSWNKLSLSSDGANSCSISIDSNDDIHISHSDVAVNSELEYATASGSGKGVKQHTTWEISPALPDGLHMNWRSG
ncbi:MAG: putative Ig domain-containing protein, partial [Candidatus Poseidoniaceae archaeon]|nr:putative Ig domain-containing protein [Candidatus Poseidoniaceae archaeon]